VTNYNFIMGRLGSEPEANYTPSGKLVVRLSVAVNKSYDPDTKEEGTEWLSLSCWEELGQAVQDTLHTGNLIAAKGVITTWESDKGPRKQMQSVRDIGLVTPIRRAESVMAEAEEEDMGDDW
jgi:single stranded DNA-binding protein